MMSRLVAWLPERIVYKDLPPEEVVPKVIALLKDQPISVVERNLLTAAILDKLQALPLHAILDADESTGEIVLQGKPLDVEKARQLQEAAISALRNKALHLVREQVVYEAFVGAAMKSKDAADLTFYRAALWWGQEVERLLKLLAQRTHEEPDL